MRKAFSIGLVALVVAAVACTAGSRLKSDGTVGVGAGATWHDGPHVGVEGKLPSIDAGSEVGAQPIVAPANAPAPTCPGPNCAVPAAPAPAPVPAMDDKPPAPPLAGTVSAGGGSNGSTVPTIVYVMGAAILLLFGWMLWNNRSKPALARGFSTASALLSIAIVLAACVSIGGCDPNSVPQPLQPGQGQHGGTVAGDTLQDVGTSTGLAWVALGGTLLNVVAGLVTGSKAKDAHAIATSATSWINAPHTVDEMIELVTSMRNAGFKVEKS